MRASGGRRKPSALVLAAGASTRFGTPKQLAKLRGRTLIERALDTVPTTLVRETVVVLGHRAPAITKAISGRAVKLVVNPEYRSGMSTSIASGVRSLAHDTPGVLVLLADQPLLTTGFLRKMLGLFEEAGSIVAASDGDVVSPPVIFPKRFFVELEGLTGDRGAKAVIERHQDEVVKVVARSKRLLADIDTKEDLADATGR